MWDYCESQRRELPEGGVGPGELRALFVRCCALHEAVRFSFQTEVKTVQFSHPRLGSIMTFKVFSRGFATRSKASPICSIPKR